MYIYLTDNQRTVQSTREVTAYLDVVDGAVVGIEILEWPKGLRLESPTEIEQRFRSFVAQSREVQP